VRGSYNFTSNCIPLFSDVMSEKINTMLQFLIDEYLPGYLLPKRRVTIGNWGISSGNTLTKTWYQIVPLYEEDELMALRQDDNKQTWILTDQCTEYLYCYRFTTHVTAWDKIGLYLS